jgi:hypothetical protein
MKTRVPIRSDCSSSSSSGDRFIFTVPRMANPLGTHVAIFLRWQRIRIIIGRCSAFASIYDYSFAAFHRILL